MNDRTWTYTRDMGALYREATAKIERLQAELDFTIKALYASPYNLALASHSDKAEVIRNDDLTVRDHIAIAAMEGILARQSFGLEDFVAERAYEQADAMLKARKK